MGLRGDLRDRRLNELDVVVSDSAMDQWWADATDFCETPHFAS